MMQGGLRARGAAQSPAGQAESNGSAARPLRI